jgi:hypothetical protein
MAIATGTALALGGGLSAAGSVAGGIMGANAAENAAAQQAAAARDANKLQREMFETQRRDLEPWRKAGVSALSGLSNADFQRDFTNADFQQDPGYQFRMSEGMKALERSAAAKGGLATGGTLKALTRYGQDFASNEYNNAYNRFNADRDRRFNRLSAIAGVGQTANTQLGQAGQNYASQAGSNLMGAANARGAAGIAGANALGGAIRGVGGAAMDLNWMDMWDKSNGGKGIWK